MRVVVVPGKPKAFPKLVPMKDRRSAKIKLTRCRKRLKGFCQLVLQTPHVPLDELRAEAQRHLDFLDVK